MFTAREDSGKPAGMKKVVKSISKNNEAKKVSKQPLPQEKLAKTVSNAY